jgi:hypothetical protein
LLAEAEVVLIPLELLLLILLLLVSIEELLRSLELLIEPLIALISSELLLLVLLLWSTHELLRVHLLVWLVLLLTEVIIELLLVVLRRLVVLRIEGIRHELGLLLVLLGELGFLLVWASPERVNVVILRVEEAVARFKHWFAMLGFKFVPSFQVAQVKETTSFSP